MGILIGMDEAGYGPNLGPLVVAATVWEERSEVGIQQTENENGSLYVRLQDAISPSPCPERIAIADSKALYQSGQSIENLERGVHSACYAVARNGETNGNSRRGLTCWLRLIEFLKADLENHRDQLPWHARFNCPLPREVCADVLTALGQRLTECTTSNGVVPKSIRARLVFPAEFNRLTEHYGTKGAALSHITVGLLREVIDEVPCDEAEDTLPFHCVLDKHGGRNRYMGILQHHFPEHWIETVGESRSESRYLTKTAKDAPLEIRFRTGGEAFLPTALASMTAKYLRELAMLAFNGFWCARLPQLRPTAGYPQDARRFKAEIRAEQQRLGISDHILWRNR